MKHPLLFPVFLLTLSFSASATDQPGFTLTILHVNDTHQMDGPQTTKWHLVLEGETEERPIQGEVGGLARTAGVIDTLRAAAVHPLVLHGGDFHHRKSGTSDWDVAQDTALWNAVGLDAAALGNNDTDDLAGWLKTVRFPVLAANSPLAGQPGLGSFVVKSYGNDRVGIIGLTEGNLGEAAVVVQKTADLLTSQGIDKIIVVSHLGWDEDLKLAARVTGLDVVVGAHSHTLAGNWKIVGLGSHGDYPTEVRGPGKGRVLVVQAGEFGQVVGNLRVEFDARGRVTAWKAGPVAVVGTRWFRVGGLTGPDGNSTKVQFLRKTGRTEVLIGGPGGTWVPATEEQAAQFLPVLDRIDRTLAHDPRLQAVSSP